MQEELNRLKARLRRVYDLNAISRLLHWDQATYMPPGGAPARGRQLALIRQMAHREFTDPEIGRLLDALQPYAEELPPDHDDAALIRVTRYEYERATKVPEELVTTISAHLATAYQVWTRARPDNDFKLVQPYLERTLELSREVAMCFPGYDHIADPLIDAADRGMTVATLRPLFAQLREHLLPLVNAITAQEAPDDACLHAHYPAAEQLAFGEEVIRRFGYDFTRGRQDQTHHPFMTKFSVDDVRITTRVKEDDLSEALFSTLHEAGHALYEQGVNREYEGTPLARGASGGVHESQSRLWENVVGRSRPFWEFFYPRLQARFPQQLGTVPLETFYRAINKVERSLIRTDADEVTYNLHVMVRFELELELLEGTLEVRDLPEAWRARYEEYVGITPPDDRDGVLQDVHWYGGLIGGAFQSYTLGNIMSAQIFEAATRAHPEISDEIRQGTFSTLHAWLREQLYRHGAKFTPAEVLERATGQPLSVEPYVRYLRRKFGELYRLGSALTADG
ncbi:MAG: carboxypeptidase M32 [Ardenticatenia bacterium]|nr:carboxypeptidase M32 [Ardenticatenia bacterium]